MISSTNKPIFLSVWPRHRFDSLGIMWNYQNRVSFVSSPSPNTWNHFSPFSIPLSFNSLPLLQTTAEHRNRADVSSGGDEVIVLLSCITRCATCAETRSEWDIALRLLLGTLKTTLPALLLTHVSILTFQGWQQLAAASHHWSLLYFVHHRSNVPSVSFLMRDSFTLLRPLSGEEFLKLPWWATSTAPYLNSPRPPCCQRGQSKSSEQSLLHTNSSLSSRKMCY